MGRINELHQAVTKVLIGVSTTDSRDSFLHRPSDLVSTIASKDEPSH